MPVEPPQSRFLTVARLLRAQGNRGELAAELTSDDARILEGLPVVLLWDGAGRRERRRIERTWPHKNRLIFKFEGIDTISQAEQLAGWHVQIEAGDRPPAPPGRYYLADLVGCRIEEVGSGRTVGQVSGVVEASGRMLLEVDDGKRGMLIPFAAAICVAIDLASRTIRVALPEGLEELG